MNTTMLRAMTMGVAALAMGTGAMAQTTPGRLYHLRAGSSDQHGCFGACLCPVLIQQPMRGTFVLTQTSVDPLFANYAVTNVRWRSPSLNETLLGSGTYRIGGEVALVEEMAVDVSINGDAPIRFDSGLVGVGPGPRFPVITIRLGIPNVACYHTELQVNATPFMGDWNGDGNVVTQDIFEFLSSWFADDGDANNDGVANVQDVFDFVNGWFAGT